MENCKCTEYYFFNLANKIYFTINISTLILLCFLQKNKFYEDECFLEKIYYSELEPISNVYLSSYKTNNSIPLGYLEEFSGKYMNISPKEIYKWKYRYININRTYVSFPNSNPPDYFDIYNDGNILLDIKVSFKDKLDLSHKRNSNICFSMPCLAKNGNCKIPFLKVLNLEQDYSDYFISDNSIEISSRNSSEFYDPITLYLYLIYRKGDFDKEKYQMKYVNIYKNTIMSIIIINPILRIVKIILLLFIELRKYEWFTLINIFSFIYHVINATLLLVIHSYYKKLPYEDDTLKKIQISLIVLEFICLILRLLINYESFSDKPNCNCYCGCCYKDNTKKGKN